MSSPTRTASVSRKQTARPVARAGRNARQPRTRQRILDAAFDLFARQGFSGTTISEVERQVGLAAGTGSFYRHFRSKEELFTAALEHEVALCMAEVDAERQSTPAPENPEQARKFMLQRTLKGIRRFDRVFRLMLSEGERVPELRESIAAALAGPGKELRWQEHPGVVVLLAALGGYHMFRLLRALPFEGVTEEEFIAALATLPAEWGPQAQARHGGFPG